MEKPCKAVSIGEGRSRVDGTVYDDPSLLIAGYCVRECVKMVLGRKRADFTQLKTCERLGRIIEAEDWMDRQRTL